jgi:glycosyltransferase involved in cell wall biosynthesis
MKICFVAPNIYPCLSKEYSDKKIGGSEIQQITIGKSLRDRGYAVSCITMDHGQPEAEVIDNLIIYKTFKTGAGLPVIRFIHPRLTGIWKALINADADVYYTRGASLLAGILALFCRAYKKKFIFASASDSDFIPDMLLVSTLRDKFLFKYGLKRASAIVVQSKNQKKLLNDNFDLDGKIINSFLNAPAKPLEGHKREYFLWVSTIRGLKRPMHFIELARNLPNEKFVMIGGPANFERGLFKKIRSRSYKLSNLKFLGFQPFETTERYFDGCKAFINTSSVEGFPNTFLQAWQQGIPVISYVDPDNIIKKNHLGKVVRTENELKNAVHSFDEWFVGNSDHIREYFEKNHSFEVVNRYIELLENI